MDPAPADAGKTGRRARGGAGPWAGLGRRGGDSAGRGVSESSAEAGHCLAGLEVPFRPQAGRHRGRSTRIGGRGMWTWPGLELRSRTRILSSPPVGVG